MSIDLGADLKPAPITVCRSLTYLSPSSSVISVIAERLQEMGKGPLRHVPPLLSRLGVGEGEMNTFENTGCDHIIGGIRETAIGTHLLDRPRVGCEHGESYVVAPKIERERAGVAAEIVCMAIKFQSATASARAVAGAASRIARMAMAELV